MLLRTHISKRYRVGRILYQIPFYIHRRVPLYLSSNLVCFLLIFYLEGGGMRQLYIKNSNYFNQSQCVIGKIDVLHNNFYSYSPLNNLHAVRI